MKTPQVEHANEAN